MNQTVSFSYLKTEYAITSQKQSIKGLLHFSSLYLKMYLLCVSFECYRVNKDLLLFTL